MVSFFALAFFLTFSIQNASASSEVVPYGSVWTQISPGSGPVTLPLGDQAGSGPGGTGSFTCSGYDFNTYWTPDSEIDIQKTVILPPGTKNLVVAGALDNDIDIFVNGHEITPGKQIRDGCAFRDNFAFTAPDADLVSGNNVITIKAYDRGVVDFLDVHVTADLGQTSIPDFPFPFSLVIIFGAVAAVYMGIRQKMTTNFKSF
ncbi:MAG TPA: hypothetical protein VEU72_06880 [Nitrosopumilaceae archaeon]|nr:hypothetical protein [Nitrosopumilaceae archaeon]